MQITIDTHNLTDLDRELLARLPAAPTFANTADAVSIAATLKTIVRGRGTTTYP